jgi:hypothetical protein
VSGWVGQLNGRMVNNNLLQKIDTIIKKFERPTVKLKALFDVLLEERNELEEKVNRQQKYINDLEYLIELIRNGDPGIENIPFYKKLFGYEE